VGDLDAKVFLMTGATEGIGKAAGKAFAERGATLVITARNRDKGERLVADWKATTGNGRIELLTGDLSKLDDVRAVAAAFRARHDRLDVLVNNAGAFFTSHQLTADGLEMTFALNHLSYFLMTHELMDVLKRTEGARIVNTSSGAHRSGRLDLDTVARRPSKKVGYATYCDSKLANILFTRVLARRLSGTAVTANCFHPGFVRTGFGLNNHDFMGAAIKVSALLFGRTPEKGAETLIWLATSPEAARYSGEYFQDRAVACLGGLPLAPMQGTRAYRWHRLRCRTRAAIGDGRCRTSPEPHIADGTSRARYDADVRAIG
jgi:NAD(P)-dependent dehydrogenase (short-subunit alcohol dehydrogenase family)